MAVDFEAHFWNRYPKKVGKKLAQQIWTKLNPNEELANTIASSLEAHKKTAQWKRNMQDPGMPYIPRPETWLRQERWEDLVTCGPMAETNQAVGIDPEIERLCGIHMVPRHDMLMWLEGAYIDDGRLIVPDDTCYGWVAKHYGPLFGLPVTRR